MESYGKSAEAPMTKSSATRGWKSSCVRLALLCLVSFFALLAAELNAIAQGAAASKVYTIAQESERKERPTV